MKEEKLKGKFTYDGQADTYVATVKKPYQWWWWLLLLLIFVPLFIRCERTVKVKVVDSAGNPVESVDLTLEYTAHFFLAHEEAIEEKQTTDSKGNAEFDGLECSVYSYIFHGSETMTITADPPAPYIGKSVDEPFHTTDNVKIVLDETGVPVKVQVIDAMNGQPLSGADVVVTRSGSGVGTFVTDMNGMATVPDVKRSDKLSLAGRKAGIRDQRHHPGLRHRPRAEREPAQADTAHEALRVRRQHPARGRPRAGNDNLRRGHAQDRRHIHRRLPDLWHQRPPDNLR